MLNWEPLLDVRECKVMSKQRKLSEFFGQQHRQETAEAEPQKGQSSESKSKLPKRNFQQSWLEKNKWLKFDVPFALPKARKKNHFTIGSANLRTSTLARHI